MSASDLGTIRWPVDPVLSADGKSLAYVFSGVDLDRDHLSYRLHLRDLDTGEETVHPRRRIRKPLWSSHGRSLAYLRETARGWQVALHGRENTLTEMAGGVAAFAWSPGGDRIVAVHAGGDPAYPRSVAPPGRTAGVVLADVTTGEVRRPAAVPGPVRAARWSPSGDEVCLVVADTVGDSLWLAPDGGGAPRRLLSWEGPVNSCEWSPDGRLLAVAGRPVGVAPWLNHELWVVDTRDATPPLRLAPGLDRSIGQAVRGDDERGVAPVDVQWAVNGTEVLAVYADGGRSLLGAFGLDGSLRPVAGGDRAILDFSAPWETDRVVISWSDSRNPGELSLLSGGEEKAVTDLNAGWLSTVELAPTAAIAPPPSGATRVEGWLTSPTGGDEPFPLVVQVHGGPHYPVGQRFSFDAQRLAGMGIALLRTNPRGSQGYGTEHASAIAGDWGGGDFEDIVSVMEAALRTAPIDPDRLGIIGESYGGFMVNWALGRTSRFRAGVAENGVSDLIAIGRGPNGPGFWHLELGGSPEEAPDQYTRRSPLTHVGSIDTPLLLIHAEEDTTCPIEQSETMLAAMSALGKEVSMFRVPGEEHFINVFGRPSRRRVRTDILDSFLLKHLLVVP